MFLSTTCRPFLPWLTRKEEGAAYLEYALLAMLIAVACVVAITAFGSALANLYSEFVSRFPHSS